MAHSVHKKSWKASHVRTGIGTVHNYKGHTCTGTNWVISEAVAVNRPEDQANDGRLVFIERTPDEAEDYARKLLGWAAEARKRQQAV